MAASSALRCDGCAGDQRVRSGGPAGPAFRAASEEGTAPPVGGGGGAESVKDDRLCPERRHRRRLPYSSRPSLSLFQLSVRHLHPVRPASRPAPGRTRQRRQTGMHHIFGLGDSHSDHKGAGSHRNSLHSCKRNKKGRVAGIITSIHVPDRRQSAQMSRDNSSTLSGDGSSTLTDGADRSVPVSREHSRQSLDTDGVPMPAQSGAHVQRQNPTADGPALTPLKENPAVQRTDSTPATSNTTARSDIIVEAKGETPKFQHQSTSPLIYQKDSNSSLKSAGISSSSVPSERKSLNLGQLGHTPQTSIDEDSIDGKNRISVSDDRASVKSADQPRRALGDHSEGSVFRKNAGEETALDRDHNTKGMFLFLMALSLMSGIELNHTFVKCSSYNPTSRQS